MKSVTTCIATFLLGPFFAFADDHEKEASPKLEFNRLLDIVRKKTSPNIYGSVYYPRWKKPLDGLKSVAAEAIAENANHKMRNDGLRLKIVGEPIVDGDVAGVLMQRSGGGIKAGVFPAYLYCCKRNGWGFLGFPIPYKRPIILGFLRDSDDEFYEDALNDLTPYDGVLYEFDMATKKKYEAISHKLKTASRALKKRDGAMLPSAVPKQEAKDKP